MPCFFPNICNFCQFFFFARLPGWLWILLIFFFKEKAFWFFDFSLWLLCFQVHGFLFSSLLFPYFCLLWLYFVPLFLDSWGGIIDNLPFSTVKSLNVKDIWHYLPSYSKYSQSHSNFMFFIILFQYFFIESAIPYNRSWPAGGRQVRVFTVRKTWGYLLIKLQ